MQAFDHYEDALGDDTIVPKRRKRTSGEGDARNKKLLQEFQKFLKDLENTPRRPSKVLQIQFYLLNLRNPKECRLAIWPQIDEPNRRWRFPLMQRDGAEIVEIELHDGLMHLLRQARLLTRGDGQGWVFPSATDINEPYSEHAAYKVILDLDYKIKQLDFRRVYEYWAERRPGRNSLEDWWRWLSNQ